MEGDIENDSKMPEVAEYGTEMPEAIGKGTQMPEMSDYVNGMPEVAEHGTEMYEVSNYGTEIPKVSDYGTEIPEVAVHETEISEEVELNTTSSVKVGSCLGNSVGGIFIFFYTFFHFSSLHGFGHITRRGTNPLEKLFWLVVCLAALLGAVSTGLQTWERFQTNPTVVSMERNYKEWNTSFPTVVICPEAKYSEEALASLLQDSRWDKVKDKRKLAELLRELSAASYGTFDRVQTDLDELKPTDYIWALSKIAFPFKAKVSNSNPEKYNVNKLNRFMSEVGICHSYNSDVTHYNDPIYWIEDRRSSLGEFPIFQSNPLDGDIFAQMRGMNSGYKLYLTGPSEFPDVGMLHSEASNNSYRSLEVTALSLVSSRGAKALSVGQRRCRLKSETVSEGERSSSSSDSSGSRIYTYNLCRQDCRRRLAFKLCACVPFFYRPLRKYPICSSNGMKCLQNNSDLLMRLVDPGTGKRLPCDCYPLCDEVNYFVDADISLSWSLGTNLKIGLIKYPKFRLKRDIIFGSSDLLVSIGGSAGLFLGCSILSIAEAIYYFCLRPLYYWIYKLPFDYSSTPP